MSGRTVTISGAGIAGLTAALACAAEGFHVDIFEQAAQLSEVGAGLQLSPNATRILDRLGVLADLEQQWSEPDRIALVSGTTLSELAHVPAGSFARNRWKAPYGVLMRATLQNALLRAVENHPRCHLHMGQTYDPARVGKQAEISDRKDDLVIGADGVWSKLRPLVPGTAPARFSGRIAWRKLLPFRLAPEFLSKTQVTAFLGPRSHLVCYPLRDADAYNLVGISHGRELPKSYGKPLESAEYAILEKAFSSWSPKIQSLMLTGETPLCWPLYEMQDGPWQNGKNLVLIGDAAHAMTPFAAQGACMAIEDAYLLARHLAEKPAERALPDFEAERRLRVDRVRKRAAFNQFAYHAQGPIRIGRDLVLSMRTPESLARDFDWLYGA